MQSDAKIVQWCNHVITSNTYACVCLNMHIHLQMRQAYFNLYAGQTGSPLGFPREPTCTKTSKGVCQGLTEAVTTVVEYVELVNWIKKHRYTWGLLLKMIFRKYPKEEMACLTYIIIGTSAVSLTIDSKQIQTFPKLPQDSLMCNFPCWQISGTDCP